MYVFRSKFFLSLTAIIGFLLVAGLGARAAGTAIDVVASNWKFTPAKIEANVGKPTTLNFTSTEGVHGIASTDLGIPQTMIVPGKSVAVTFTPQKAGSYPVHCAIVCGAGHDAMLLTIDVAP